MGIINLMISFIGFPVVMSFVIENVPPGLQGPLSVCVSYLFYAFPEKMQDGK